VATDPRITLLGRPGCHLCDEARAVVERVAAEAGVTWQERSVDADPDLRNRYGDLVPVVLVDGEQHAYWRVDAGRLARALEPGGGRDGAPWWRLGRRRTP
jgi:glutaredoxin